MLEAFSKIFTNRGRIQPSELSQKNMNVIRVDKDYEYGFEKDNILQAKKIVQNLSEKLALYEKVYLEIGFGTGDNILHQLKSDSKVAIVGCDPFVKGAYQLASKIQDIDLNRVFIACQPAGFILNNISENSFDRIFVLFPDPWHKKKHNKRRIFSNEFLASVSRAMKTNAEMIFASDNEEYAKQVLNLVKNFDGNLCVRSVDSDVKENDKLFEDYPDNLAVTKYMKKSKNRIYCLRIYKNGL